MAPIGEGVCAVLGGIRWRGEGVGGLGVNIPKSAGFTKKGAGLPSKAGRRRVGALGEVQLSDWTSQVPGDLG